MAWYASRREAILAGEKLTPQNREEALLMGLIEPSNEREIELFNESKKITEKEKSKELEDTKEEKAEEPKEEKKPKRKKKSE